MKRFGIAELTARVVVLCMGMDLSLTPAFAQTASEASDQTPAPAAESAGAASGGAEDLAKDLANPIASQVSVSFQLNWDFGLGPEDGRRSTINFQPVLPFSLNDDWSLITRIIAPVIAQPVLTTGGEPSFGLGDILLSEFFSPKRGDVIWGVGPAAALPVTSDPTLGSGKFSIGPTVAVLIQAGPWTFGGLTDHVWSVAGDYGRAGVSQTSLQPFVTYTTKSAYSFTLNSETIVNWKADRGEQWTVPFNLVVSKVVEIGRRPIFLAVGGRYYALSPTGGPEWGLRSVLTLLFPVGPRP